MDHLEFIQAPSTHTPNLIAHVVCSELLKIFDWNPLKFWGAITHFLSKKSTVLHNIGEKLGHGGRNH